jgi:hypothetical protein
VARVRTYFGSEERGQIRRAGVLWAGYFAILFLASNSQCDFTTAVARVGMGLVGFEQEGSADAASLAMFMQSHLDG